MIVDFGDHGTEDIYNFERTKEACKTPPAELHGVAKRKLNYIAVATCLKDLSCPPGNRLERLSGNLSAYHSIRINSQWRIIFIWDDAGAHDVKIVDYH